MRVSYTYSARVRSVYDGDTLRADIDLGFHTWMHNRPIRLWGVDTPELRGVERQEGLAVRDWVSKVVPGEFVLESIEDGLGKYGRILGIVWPVGFEESLNARLLRTGRAVIPAYMDEKEVRARFNV